jgi:hypothetical protein
VVNAIRVVGHVNHGVGAGGIERAIMPVAAAVHLRLRAHTREHRDHRLKKFRFHKGTPGNSGDEKLKNN